MTKNDAELIQEMTRVRKEDDRLLVQVAVIDWQHPHEPSISWILVQELAFDSSDASINVARSNILKNKDLFEICGECGKRNAKGYMCSPGLCMGCAEKNHGVVF